MHEQTEGQNFKECGSWPAAMTARMMDDGPGPTNAESITPRHDFAYSLSIAAVEIITVGTEECKLSLWGVSRRSIICSRN